MDEYDYLMNGRKNKIYKDIAFQCNPKVIRHQYDNYEKRINDHKDQNIFTMVEMFSSYELKSNTPEVVATINSGRAIIDFDNWLSIFNDGICNDFLLFLNDKNLFGCFFYNGVFDETWMENFLKLLDGLM